MKERKNKIRKGKERDRTKDREKKKKQKRERQRKAGSPPLLSRALVTAETNYRLLRKAYEWAGTSDLSVIFFLSFFWQIRFLKTKNMFYRVVSRTGNFVDY